MTDKLKQKLIFYGFIVFVLFYASLFLINSHLGPNDDFVFLRTLQSGKPLIYASDNFPYYDWKGLGRFQPLVSMEYNIIGFFSKSPSPFWYYLIHAIEFLAFIFIFIKLLRFATQKKSLQYTAAILFVFLPAFTFSWFRLQLPERNILFLFTAFLLCYFLYSQKQKVRYLILAGIIANLSIYYKEINFAVIGIFALSHLIFSRKSQNINSDLSPHLARCGDKKIKLFDYFLLFSSFAYAIIYYFLIYRNATSFFLGKQDLIYSQLLVYLKNIFNYAFFSDPILVLLLLPLLVLRFYKVFVKKENPEPLYDSMLLTGSVYVIAYFILKLYNPYYLLPAYAFVIPALIYFSTQGELKTLLWKIVIFITCFLLITNSIPAGIHFLTWHKYVPINFNKTLDFLAKDINSKQQKNSTNIFLDDIDLAAGRGVYFIFEDFLLSKGLTSKQFDFKSNTPTSHPEPVFSKIQMSSTVFNKDTPDEIKKGDYLIVTPQSQKNITKKYIESLNKDYELVFNTQSKFEFPQINLKILAKYIILKKQQKNPATTNNVIASQNLLDSPNYYVFIKK